MKRKTRQIQFKVRVLKTPTQSPIKQISFCVKNLVLINLLENVVLKNHKKFRACGSKKKKEKITYTKTKKKKGKKKNTIFIPFSHRVDILLCQSLINQSASVHIVWQSKRKSEKENEKKEVEKRVEKEKLSNKYTISFPVDPFFFVFLLVLSFTSNTVIVLVWYEKIQQNEEKSKEI